MADNTANLIREAIPVGARREILLDILVRELPLAFIDKIIFDIHSAYSEADAHVHGYKLLGDPEKRNLEPHLRRGIIETKFRTRAIEFGLRASIEKNSKDSADYTLVRAGSIELTHSKTQSPNALPALCDFRAQRSDANNKLHQAALFPVPDERDDAVTYAILTHGPRNGSKEVGFINIGFPSPDFKGWAEPPLEISEIRERIISKQRASDDDAGVEPVFKRGVVKRDDDKEEREE